MKAEIPEGKQSSHRWDQHLPADRPKVTISLLFLTGLIETPLSYWSITLSMRTLPPSYMGMTLSLIMMMLGIVNICVGYFLYNHSLNARRIGIGVNAILVIINVIGFVRILFSVVHAVILFGLLDQRSEHLPQTFPSFSKEFSSSLT